MKAFFEEFAYVFLFALAVWFFIKGFSPLAKIIGTKIPIAGVKEALAA
jgi:hypothetical protein